mmetsp:Transcript_3805/g.12654  ORF Transcript_3805/g.12654 Transcript_3805/m.12654 type:complete len:207 (-) Transcript_3805:133-753(-)
MYSRVFTTRTTTNMLTTFSSSHTISNTEAAILSRRSRSSSFSGFNKRRRERREALLTILMASGKEDETEDKEEDKEDKEEEMSKLSRAMATARQNEKLGFSPGYVKGGGGGGGGVSSSVSSLLSAEESAEAAFADLINTSANDERKEGDNDVKKLNLSELAKGSRMSEEAVRQKDTNIGGVLGDLINLGSILLKGGHIVKKKDGRV